MRVKSWGDSGLKLVIPNLPQKLQLHFVATKVPSGAIGILTLYLMALVKYQYAV